MTTTQRDAIVSPTKGLLIYNTTTDTLNVYNGSWGAVGGGSATWGSITGTLSAQTDLQSALDLKATLASPTFTGTVVMPTPFTLGATSVTSTGTQLNYLSSTTGTTGTTNTNVVFSTSPTLVTPVLGVATGTSLALTYGGTTAVTTASGLVLNANSLTIGTGLYAASSTLTSGLLVDLQVSGTAAAASQTALNILTTGANATTAITTYGGQISNTHTNATSGSNVALYLNASGATTANYGLIVNAGRVGIGTTAPLLLLDVAGSQRLTGATTTVLTGSINAIASTTITGVNTLFTTELVVGDRITVTGETRTVVAIASATSLTVDLATTDTANDTAVDKLAAVFIARDANSIPQLVINDEGLASFNSLESGGLNFETDAGAVSWMDMPVSDVPLDDTIQSYTAHLGGNPLLTIYGLADSAGAVDTLRVGIATTIPQSLLDVQGPTGTGATSAGILTLATKELTIVDGDELGRINFNSPLESDGSDSILAGAAIWAEANDTFSTTVNSTELAFGTATTSAAVERMRINSAGNVGIGTTAPSTLLHVGLAGTTLGTIGIAGNTSGLVTLSVAAAAGTWTMKLPAAVGTAGFQLTDAAGDGITSWTGAGSKREYKDILGTMEPKDALSAILSTAVYRFKYKEGFGTGDYTTEYVGILAEEAPWAVHFNGTIINPVNTLGYAVLGIQGLNLKLEGLETRIAILEANGDGIKNEEAIAVFGQYATDFFNSVVKNVVDGVVYMKGLVVDTLKVGSPTKRTGVTLYDEVTGDPYCLSVSNGIQKTTAGGCGIIEPAPIPSLEPTVIDQPPTEKLADEPPVEIPQTDPDPTITPTPDPSIITNPEPTPILEPEPE
ncbi:MAG: hypothetical protein EXS69_02630 [Candidatus Zambryskibacteria bacterium]|nr:hypothetical protein [Candidatus Zambryskibacteria bacterium]